MNPGGRAVEIQLEPVVGVSWPARRFAGADGRPGYAYLRFVVDTDEGRTFRSPTFAAARAPDVSVLKSDSAPDMQWCLDRIRCDMRRDGWTEVDRGAQDWSLRYERR